MSSPILSRRLNLQTLIRSADGAGGYSQNWVDTGVLWASVRATSGREGEVDHTKRSKTGYDIILRNAPYDAPSRPKPDQRFKEGNRIFRILAVVEKDPAGKYLHCTAVEEVAT